ncbi:probable palmitoyltransferase zdhhc1 [Stylonychia lemnae]|uniref:Probable palmitoyltransferase zdhhc1 n=1 Tax=Stylonychia lemnae TaxID=5949 RepID=A0A078BDV1_STYLE|nr:probable palmitoyltransferase zdhhc1 [Stylonychia lemnae]|eukprot:CDW91758.1 probable palmitoyltransferase zdhhc1 [Stylonychia lemnae]
MQATSSDDLHKLQTSITPDKVRKSSIDLENEQNALDKPDHQDQNNHDHDNTDSQIGEVKIIKKNVRKNGFAMPFHPFQIISWVIFGLDSYAFYFINIVTFSYQPAISIVLGVAYLIIFIAVLYYAIRSTRYDPTDPTIYKNRQAEKTGEYFDSSPYDLYCEVCESPVQNSAKHCGQCNRCVSGFDHHCRWLNNCIGEGNYVYFFRVICSFFAMTVLHNATDAAVLFYLDSDDSYLLKNQNFKFYKHPMTTEFKTILITSIVFNTAAIGFLGHLISFHIFLQKKQLTTFEYIQIKQGRMNYKSKIFKEIHHEDAEENHNENQGNLETDNAAMIQSNLQTNKAIDDDKEFQEIISEDKNKCNDSLIQVKDGQGPAGINQLQGGQNGSNSFNHVERKSSIRKFFCKSKKKSTSQKIEHQKLQEQQILSQMNSNSSQMNPNIGNNKHQSVNSSELNLQNQLTDRSLANTSPLGLVNYDKVNNNDVSQKGSSANNSADLSNHSSPSEAPAIFSNDQHMMNVIHFATGGDDQKHVSNPISKSTMNQAKQRKDFINKMLNKNRSELETIQEKVKEEELAQSMSNINIKNLDVEESYSFSLRNYPGHKIGNQPTNNYNNQLNISQSANRLSQVNNQNVNDSYKSNQISYSQPYQSDILGNLPPIDPKNNSFYGNPSKTLGDLDEFKSLQTDLNNKQRMSIQENAMKIKSDQLLNANSNSKQRVQQMNNFLDHSKIAIDNMGSSPSNMVVNLNRFSSHVQPYQGKENMGGLLEKQNEQKKDIAVLDQEIYQSRNQRSSMPVAHSNKIKVPQNQNKSLKQNQWMGPNDQIGKSIKSQPEEINESIMSCEDDDQSHDNEDELGQTSQTLKIKQSLQGTGPQGNRPSVFEISGGVGSISGQADNQGLSKGRITHSQKSFV